MKRIIFFLSLITISNCSFLYARENIREVFKNNEAIIYTINIRNFGAIDLDKNGLIEVEKGDIKGTFLNAKEKLKNLKADGINTIYLLPITPVGKLKALGSAGSLYALDSFDKINPEFDDTANPLNVYQEAQEFVKEAHKLNLNVIVDLPSCGSYDLSIRKPNWFLSDKNSTTIIPADWSDVRLFKVYNNDNKTLNEQNLENFKSFVDMVQSIGFDGIRADVAAIKPGEFWKKIIDYARSKDENFLFLAEASPDWENPASDAIGHYSSIDELLNSGFDSYYGSWSDFKNIKTKKEFDLKIEKNIKILKRNKNKSMIASFATHDQQAPILRSKNYWNMVLFLNATLPLNSYFLDGFIDGDDYIYDYENKKAQYSKTDDEYYFVHSGMFDIFNNTAPVKIKHPEFKKDFYRAIVFKNNNIDLINNGKFKILKTDSEKVFAYSITLKNKELIVAGSLNEDSIENTDIKSEYIKKDGLFSLINTKTHPQINGDTLTLRLEPLELQIYLITLANSQAN